MKKLLYPCLTFVLSASIGTCGMSITAHADNNMGRRAMSIKSVSVSQSMRRDRFYYERNGYAYWQIPIHEKAVALTFDDGPNETFTPQILKLLRIYQDHATFFVVGNRLTNYAAILKQEYADGNEIGNHTYSHHLTNELPQKTLEEEIEHTNEIVQRYTGHTPHLFRPPGGYYNDKIVNAALYEHCKVIIWSWDQDSRDWKSLPSSYLAKSILSHLHPGDIILMHDNGGDRTNTINALKVILPALKKAGYRSTTVSDLFTINKKEHTPILPSSMN